jgi:paraquat-inducible protein B
VIFKGVKIGSVTGISLRFDPANLKYQIPVYIDILPDRVDRTGPLVREPARTLRLLIEKGFRARLEMQSVVTGQLMIALDFYPEEPPRFVGDGSFLEIPTIPTAMENLAKKLEDIHLEELVARTSSAVAGIDRLVNSPEIMQSIANLNHGLNSFREMLDHLKAQIEPIGTAVKDTVSDTQTLVRNVDNEVSLLGPSLRETVADTRKLVGNVDRKLDPVIEGILSAVRKAEGALRKAESAIGELAGSIHESPALMAQLNETLSEFSKAARAVRGFAEYMERNPETLLRGKGERGGR